MKSDKQKIIGNVALLVILVSLIVLVAFLYGKANHKWESDAAENVVEPELTEIAYGSEIVQMGYKDADGILGAFIEGHNNHDGEEIVSIMDLVGKYIYELEGVDQEIDKFDDKYVEILSDPSSYDNLVLMQYSLKSAEESIVEGINSYNITVSDEGHSDITDVTKYISKLTADIRTVVPDEGVDDVYTLEFVLLHRDESYYIIDYYPVDNEE